MNEDIRCDYELTAKKIKDMLDDGKGINDILSMESFSMRKNIKNHEEAFNNSKFQ